MTLNDTVSLIQLAATTGSVALFLWAVHRNGRSLRELKDERVHFVTLTGFALDELRSYNRHGERVQELLETNNEYLLRARDAERALNCAEERIEALEARIDHLEAEQAERIDEAGLLETELTETKRALTIEEGEANKWANLYHALNGTQPDSSRPFSATHH